MAYIKNMINVGVIGCGKIAQVRHLPEYSDNADANIAAVTSLNRERAEEVGRKYSARVYATYEELLDDPAIDAVSVCTANASHCAITVSALKAGKHVLCEKPMATTLEDCELMVRTASETGKRLMIAHNQRFAPAHITAKDLLGQGAIGELLTFRTVFCHKGPESWTINPGDNWFFDADRAAFGVLGDLGVHRIDLLHYLTGGRITSVRATLKTLDKKNHTGGKIGLDDNALCIFEMDNGSTGTMAVSWTCYGPEENSTVLYGTQGVMRIYDDPAHSLIIDKRDGSREIHCSDKAITNDNQAKSGVIDSWIRSLVAGAPPEVPMEESLHAMKVIFAALDSSRTSGVSFCDSNC